MEKALVSWTFILLLGIAAEAIVRDISKAETLGRVPSAKELGTVPARIK